MAQSQTKPPIFVAPVQLNHDGSPRLARVLIANRGEIACRVIRSCRQLSITAVAVYADEDENSLHVNLADEAICIGPADRHPYQNIDALVKIAKSASIDAIHPGYGYLAENPQFASAVSAAGIIFIGPSAESIQKLGNKRVAKEYLAQVASIPLIPGYSGQDQDPAHLEREAYEIGYPVLIKASAGGGGKGLRVVHSKEQFKESYLRCASEAERSFGSGHCLIEKYIESGKHVEIQVIGDGETFVSLLDRECSIQRRHQKIIEESPCSWMSPTMRRQMSDCAVEIAKLLKYESAGTVEFIVDIKQEKFYFLEVNTRIQVEHPITEEVVGVDIVALQLYIAGGGKLSSLPELRNVLQRGHAIEVRLCAENPFNDFLPCTGTVVTFKTASEVLASQLSNVRYEVGIQAGSQVSVHFDSMICKIIVWDLDRAAAIQKMAYVLKNTVCLGLTTNQLFLHRILTHARFQKLDYTTSFIEAEQATILEPIGIKQVQGAAIMAALFCNRISRNALAKSYRSAFAGISASFRNQPRDKSAHLQEFVLCQLQTLGQPAAVEHMVTRVSEEEYQISTLTEEPPLTEAEKKIFFNKKGGVFTRRFYQAQATESSERLTARALKGCDELITTPSGGELRILVDDRQHTFYVALLSASDFKREISVYSTKLCFAVNYEIFNKLSWSGKFEQRAAAGGSGADGERKHVSPMPCHIIQILAPNNSEVKIGDGLLVMESMKTEIRITASAPGIVKMNVEKGSKISEGVVMCEIIAPEAP